MRTRHSGVRRLTAAAVLAALGVILLTLGSLVEVLDLSAAVVASLLVVLAVIELRGAYPYLVYAVTAVLALVLLPAKTAAVVYTLFAGYYPIVKAALEGHLPKWAAWVIKLVLVNAAAIGALFAAWKLFTVETTLDLGRLWYFLPLLVTPFFLLYDIALTRLISLYLSRWRGRLRLFR